MKKQFAYKFAAVIFVFSSSWWLAASLQAAIQAKMAISAMVVTTCNIVGSVINGAPIIRNSCGKGSEKEIDGRALLKAAGDAKEIKVTY
ncbi:hypothetical protein [Herbaspirillum robiniae]|uniref:Uncharacterized protein n=1 Tax=Herbaspirillum robiniae TaxID=2014887 RepID=A0ABX2M4F1_9BURK|nr:hypothetical protein [Herbaspirillum robiniae]NUU02724.1 hypothetical protein [Herbaspirillum robiniae]